MVGEGMVWVGTPLLAENSYGAVPRLAFIIVARFLSDVQALQSMLLEKMVAAFLKLFQTNKEVTAFDWTACSFIRADIHNELRCDGRHGFKCDAKYPDAL